MSETDAGRGLASDRWWMVFSHCFTLASAVIVAALLVPETSLRPTADRATYLAWAAFAILLPAAPGFLLRRRHPALVDYWRWSSGFALVAYLAHLGYAAALDQTNPVAVLLALWWLADTIAAATSPLGTTSAGSRLCRGLLLSVILFVLGAGAWNANEVLPRLLVGLVATVTLLALAWRAAPHSSSPLPA
jgi:hypothetical protein